MSDSGYIPIVDLGEYTTFDITKEPSGFVKQLAKDVHNAFSTVGFLYVKNHGIDQEKILNAIKATNEFFQLPVEKKVSCARPTNGENYGWVACGIEFLNPEKQADVKEAYNIVSPFNDSVPWPDKSNCPMFRKTTQDLFKSCEELALCILDLITLGLNLEDKTFMRRLHHNMCATMRFLYYPPIVKPLEDGQLRCGEHSDYGTFTLLFQDNIGGLEVRKRDGEFVAARPIEGTVLVNIGDLLQRWTNNKLVSTRHRVVVPHDKASHSKVRNSIAFFVHPDDDAVIECLDGSATYPPITALGYLQERLTATYI